MALVHTALSPGRLLVQSMKVSTIGVKSSAWNCLRLHSYRCPQIPSVVKSKSFQLYTVTNSRGLLLSRKTKQSGLSSLSPHTYKAGRTTFRTIHSHSKKSALPATYNSYERLCINKPHSSRSFFDSRSAYEQRTNCTDHHPGFYSASFFHTTPYNQRSHILSKSHSPGQLNLCTKPNQVLQSQRGDQDSYYYLNRSTQYSTASKIVEVSPKSLQPYLKLIRFDKPIGTWLLYWPCTWSIAIAAQPGALPDLRLLALFGAGAFFMRGAGCIINDMWDKDFDDKVERTKTRPLAAKDITPFQALVFLGSQLSCALAILLQLNLYSIILGASSMALVVLYPLAKRYTYWPQLVLGLTLNWGVLLAGSAIHGHVDLPCLLLYAACTLHTVIYDTIYSHQPVSLNHLGLAFNWGTLLGYSAVTGSLNMAICLPLYISGILWTITYDTIYAHQDKNDDILIGVKSTAIYLGENTKPVLTAFTTAMAGSLALAGQMADMTWPYYVGVGITAARLFQQIHSINLDETEECAQAFRGNFYLGAVLFAGILMSNLLKKTPKEESDSPSQASSEDSHSDELIMITREQFINQLNKDTKDKVFFMPK